MTDGARTHDNRNHNPGLYQLSYGHHRNLQIILLAKQKSKKIMVCPTGIEPVTPSLEGWCSIRLSYGQMELHVITVNCQNLNQNNHQYNYTLILIKVQTIKYWSAWRDSNSRHPAPKAGALPGYATRRRGRNIAHYSLEVKPNLLKCHSFKKIHD